MKTFLINVQIDRPDTGVDVVLNQPETDFNTENVTAVQQVLGANFGNLETLPDGTIISIDGQLKKDGVAIVTVNGSFSKEDINDFNAVVNPQQTQTTTAEVASETITPAGDNQ